VFDWRVPNVRQFGGRFRDCLLSLLDGLDRFGGPLERQRFDGARAKAAARRAARSERALEAASRTRAARLADGHQVVTEATVKSLP
jgi:hypothetical protein